MNRRMTWHASAAVLAVSLAALPAAADIPEGTSSLADADAKLVAEAPNCLAGFDVTSVGDVDGDGFGDVIVGTFANNPCTGDIEGAAYLVYGPVEGTVNLSEAAAKLTGEAAGDFVGEDVAPVGDLDGDGFDDLVIGGPGRVPVIQPGGPAPGAAYVIYGGPERLEGEVALADVADAKLVGEHDVDAAGFGAGPSGDLDGDGNLDLTIGAAFFAGLTGKVHLIYGDGGRLSGELALADVADAAFVGEHPGSITGFSLDAGGDLDGDRLDDLVIGAQGAFGTAGAAYVVYGGPRRSGTASLTLAAGARLVGEQAGDIAGTDVSTEGDLDGDGLDDLVVGAPAIGAAGRPGTAYVFYGSGDGLTGTMTLGAADARLVGEAPGDSAGRGVSIAGDLDGDGLDDLVVGALNQDTAGTNAGAAYVVLGGPERLSGDVGLGSADAKLTGEAEGDAAGRNVAGAGDVNGDGGADLLVGAESHDAGGQDAGAAYVLLGVGVFDALRNAIAALPDEALKASGLRNAMLAAVDEAEALADAGDTEGAVTRLRDLRKHVDGCGMSPDNDDWVIDCDAQELLRRLIDRAIEHLGR